MTTIVLEPPQPFISLDLACKHLRVSDPGKDVLIQLYIAATCSHIDGPLTWLKRSIGEQLIEHRVDSFGCEISLPGRPIIEIDAVEYIDGDGVLQDLDPAAYQLTGHVLRPAFGTSFPVVRGDVDGVRVRYLAGYSDPTDTNAEAGGGIPKSLIAATLIMLGDLWKNPDSTVEGTISTKINMSTTVEALLQPFQVWA